VRQRGALGQTGGGGRAGPERRRGGPAVPRHGAAGGGDRRGAPSAPSRPTRAPWTRSSSPALTPGFRSRPRTSSSSRPACRRCRSSRPPPRRASRWWGELELAARFVTAPILCVGGTNGKSTTTVLLGGMLQAAFARVFVGGNLGTPLAQAVGEPWDRVVVEVSSFQLERAPRFRPRVSVLLNVTDDHLDRYPDTAPTRAPRGTPSSIRRPRTSPSFPTATPPASRRPCGAARGASPSAPGGNYDLGEREIHGAGDRRAVLASGAGAPRRAQRAERAAADRRGAGGGAGTGGGAAGPRWLPAAARTGWPWSPRWTASATTTRSKGTNVGAAVTALRGLPEAGWC
jgi:UDP-N-acetylmuramoylalanine--D-glutamate ligase